MKLWKYTGRAEIIDASGALPFQYTPAMISIGSIDSVDKIPYCSMCLTKVHRTLECPLIHKTYGPALLANAYRA